MYPHHRNYYRSDEGNVSKVKDNVSATYKYRQFGYLVGGVYDGTYNDDPENYQNGEGGIDYNAGLVGALGYINSILSPVSSTPATKKITSIIMNKVPAKVKYQYGEELEIGGASIKASYSDGTSKIVNVTNNMVSGYNALKTGQQNVNVKYEGMSTSFKVTVENGVKKIELIANPTLNYAFGSDFDVTGGKIKVTLADGTTSEKPLTIEMVSGYDKNKLGAQAVTITYEKKETIFTIKVMTEDELENLTPDSTPGDIENAAGDIKAISSNIYSAGKTIYLNNIDGLVEVYDTMGHKVFSGSNIKEIQMNRPGIYIVRTGRVSKKVSIQ